MIIAFEGLSCAGKTAITSALVRENPDDYCLVPEFVVPIPNNLTTDFCRINDLAKGSLAAAYQQDGMHVLMDRSWLSTLVYEVAATGEDKQDLHGWYTTAEDKEILSPVDLYIYLRLDTEEALKRATSVGRLNMKYAWYAHADLATNKYDALFEGSLDAPAVILPADQPFERLCDEIKTIIAEKLKEKAV